MNELKKTGIFWAVTAVMLLIATVIAWPTADNTDSGSLSELVGTSLIGSFKDPLAVASMKIVSFDENEGTLSNFEVAKESDSGDWTIVSRKGYPADAVEQVTNAANSLIDLKVLDVVPCTREDHDDLGVIEPKLEDLKIGDEGVGRLVTFKDADKQSIASIIIGDRVKDSDEQINVRIPGQDPVYIVALDDKPLTTKFQDWIEEDLLKLSTIDVSEVVTKDYSASLGNGGQIALQRNFTAQFAKEGAQWELAKLLEFDPKRPTAEPKEVAVEADQKVNATKLKEIENALDDLKIVNVLRKPDGMSANLRASEDFLSDQKAVASLAGRGFYPVQLTADGGTEILSANGEMTVGLKDGVEYVLRFGNIAGLGEEDSDDESSEKEDGEEKKSTAGVNRYLLLTTRVDEKKFPAPELQEVPQTLDDLQKLDDAEAKKNAPPETAAEDKPAEAVTEDAAKEDAGSEPKEEMKSEEAAESDEEKPAEKESSDTEEKKAEMSEESAVETKPAEEKPAQEDAKTKPASEEKPKSEETPIDEANEKASGETETEGSESATATGQALQEVDDEKEESDDKESGKDADADQKKEEVANEDGAEKASDTAAEEETSTDDAGKDMKSETEEKAEAAEPEETEEEKQERLEGLQEKITKENQRKMDERKDNLAKAKNRVRDLNARFADWYYVIPEETYSKLTIKRNELFETEGDAGNAGSAGPSFQMPGGAGGFPGLPGN